MNGAAALIRKAILVAKEVVRIQSNKIQRKFQKHVSLQHQLTSTTSFDRYPEIFREVKRVVGDSQNSTLSMLSFGCSTGEECQTINRYFSNTKIVGVDINTSNLKKANRKNQAQNISFHYSTPETIQQHGPYDVIFCLSVLCRWDDDTKFIQNFASIYPFEKFNSIVSFLVDQLADNGLLIIYNSNFRFEDTSQFHLFEIVETPSIENSGFVPKYSTQNDRLNVSHRSVIYRKLVMKGQ